MSQQHQISGIKWSAEEGMTLLEVIVALTISSAIVVLAIAVYTSVNGSVAALLGRHFDWSAEQFMRAQVAASHIEMSVSFGLVRGERQEFSFVSRRSARNGYDGPMVRASYFVDVSSGRLGYSEIDLSSWWDRNPSDVRRETERVENSGTGWSTTLLTGVSDIEFSYWDTETSKWTQRWGASDRFPSAIRLHCQQNHFDRLFVFEAGDTYWSSTIGLTGHSPSLQ